jgi:hypothetical protein
VGFNVTDQLLIRSFSFVRYWRKMVKKDEMGRACSTHEAKKCARIILMGKPEGKRPLGGPRRRREDNIKMVPR